VRDGWRRLADLIRAEAARHGSLQDFADAAGLSRTVERLAAAEADAYRQHTIDRLEAVMGWQHGSVDRILEGQQPQPVPDPGWERLAAAWPRLTQRGRRIVLAVVEELLRP
jgi:hypothetical protein